MEQLNYTNEQKRVFKERFAEEVNKSGKSLDWISRKLGYSKSTIGAWYKGERMPMLEALEDICNFFQKDDVYMLGSEMRPKIYALSYGDAPPVAVGTLQEISEMRGLTIETLRAYQSRTTKGIGNIKLYKVEEEE